MTTSISRWALVTGGSRGLGRNTAMKLAERGVDVIVTYKDSEAETQAAVRDIEALGRRAVALRLDAGDSKTVLPTFTSRAPSF